ncbi:hypothetical protein D1AOALGA4SA_3212 [Olavius algarvensis Delta 1 endosymbiont]|nr:hypothetical protein D1AOALGA4SA_3212 [Olavius algarvensis Delta 1 endosymbiont]
MDCGLRICSIAALYLIVLKRLNSFARNSKSQPGEAGMIIEDCNL